ncbi:CarD family transcriptional regulator [Natranaerobius trueperi]|uniref:CarD family transcriptional regulator n=1 Tax=Natranaerobius trueperi TaxID=759412 RepID=A0A226C1N8_9FIRM|nr:CarD family transcriptional regulator [Natranaerobius trueperi]OWZ84514.1 CarD family transcriptional regulator [Natranaerobius trueperi]
MFKKGDKVVYPMHGAGVIEDIEEKEVLGKKHVYYIMRIPVGDMKVMIPKEKIDKIGLREIVTGEKIQKVWAILKDKEGAMSASWNQRYRANLEKIKTGDIFEVAEVVKNLVIRDTEKGLSTGEKKMLDNAKQILISELVLADEIDEDRALEELEDTLEKTS